MKASELRAKPAPELRANLLKFRKEQFALRLQRATGQAVKPDQFSKVRRNIARTKTVLRAAELVHQRLDIAGLFLRMGYLDTRPETVNLRNFPEYKWDCAPV